MIGKHTIHLTNAAFIFHDAACNVQSASQKSWPHTSPGSTVFLVSEVLLVVLLLLRFELPPYYSLVLRALTTLEGLALMVDPDYKIMAAAVVVSRQESNSRRTAE
jgi:hypothetical protein